MRVNNSTWVWSDTHFGHHNIIKFQSRPPTHEIVMLSNWARLVPEDATLLHLGDLHLRSNWARWRPILMRMPGRKYLVLGNHDGHGIPRYEEAGFRVVEPFVATIRGARVAFTHRPLSDWYRGHPEHLYVHGIPNDWDGAWAQDDWDVNVHGHIHLNGYRSEAGDYRLPDKRYVNASVEAINFRPHQVGALLW